MEEEHSKKKSIKEEMILEKSFISFVRKVCTQNHTRRVNSTFSLQYIYLSYEYKKVGKRSIYKKRVYSKLLYVVYKDDGPLVFVHTNSKLAAFLLFSVDCI